MGHWALRIKNVREDDRGFYECQLSVHPVQSIFIELRVVGELYQYDQVYLFCVIPFSLLWLSYIGDHHNNNNNIYVN